jgi:folate-dependent phosphoribosylglycinamide formyltransferase PurN
VHLIDERVDAATVLLRRQIPVYQDDTLQDLSERLYETQLEVLTPAIGEALRGGVPVDPDTPYNRKRPTSMEKAVGAKVGEYVRRYSAREVLEGGVSQ